jgi:hypothetical protein
VAASPYLPEVLAGLKGQLQPHGVSVNGYAASLVAKSGPSICYGLTGYNSSGSTQFIQVHDVALLPADGAVPVTILSVPTATNFAVDYGPQGRAFRQGVVVCNSSTGPTKTIGAADCWFDVVLI